MSNILPSLRAKYLAMCKLKQNKKGKFSTANFAFSTLFLNQIFLFKVNFNLQINAYTHLSPFSSCLNKDQIMRS